MVMYICYQTRGDGDMIYDVVERPLQWHSVPIGDSFVVIGDSFVSAVRKSAEIGDRRCSIGQP